MKKVKNIVFISMFIIMLIMIIGALNIKVGFECSEQDLLLYRIAGSALLVPCAIGFFVEFIICRFASGIKEHPIRKRVIMWSFIVIISVVIFAVCYAFTSSEFKSHIQKANNASVLTVKSEKKNDEVVEEKVEEEISEKTAEVNVEDKKDEDGTDEKHNDSDVMVVLKDEEVKPEEKKTEDKERGNVIIGSTADEVRKLLSKYKETKSNFDNELDFENDDLLITVFMKYSEELKKDVAEGVYFMSCNYEETNPVTLEGAYVSTHYDELVALSTDDPNIMVESDLTKYNSSGTKKAAAELYVGKVPH